MKASIKHLGEFAAVPAAAPLPITKRRHLLYAAGGVLLGGAFFGATTSGALLGKAIGGARVATAVKGVSAALGSYKGYRLANNYLGEMKSFAFEPMLDKAAEESGALSHWHQASHQYVLINGFLSQDDAELRDWRDVIQQAQQAPLQGKLFNDFGQAPSWHLRWESKRLSELNQSIAGPGVQSLLTQPWRRAPVHMLGQFADNAWHTALFNAKRTGRLLAQAILSTPAHQTFTLIGHSLGARVAFYALQELAEKGSDRVRNVVLLGAAQGRRNGKLWQHASSACQGPLFNCYTRQDSVLRWAYQSINAGMSRPAGLGPAPEPAMNLDCSAIVSSHTRWKENLLPVLQHAERAWEQAASDVIEPAADSSELTDL